jgi:hypothetical protein
MASSQPIAGEKIETSRGKEAETDGKKEGVEHPSGSREALLHRRDKIALASSIEGECVPFS